MFSLSGAATQSWVWQPHGTKHSVESGPQENEAKLKTSEDSADDSVVRAQNLWAVALFVGFVQSQRLESCRTRELSHLVRDAVVQLHLQGHLYPVCPSTSNKSSPIPQSLPCKSPWNSFLMTVQESYFQTGWQTHLGPSPGPTTVGKYGQRHRGCSSFSFSRLSCKFKIISKYKVFKKSFLHLECHYQM